MKSSSKIIMALLNTLPDSDHLYLTLIDGIWPRVIGQDLASRSQPVAWEGGTLTVAVPSEDWKDHLYLLASDLIPRVNEALGDLRLRHLAFVIDPARFTGPANYAPAPEAVVPSPAEEAAIAQSGFIRDKDLQELFRRTVARHSTIRTDPDEGR